MNSAADAEALFGVLLEALHESQVRGRLAEWVASAGRRARHAEQCDGRYWRRGFFVGNPRGSCGDVREYRHVYAVQQHRCGGPCVARDRPRLVALWCAIAARNSLAV